jgi:hypothetical protein
LPQVNQKLALFSTAVAELVEALEDEGVTFTSIPYLKGNLANTQDRKYKAEFAYVSADLGAPADLSVAELKEIFDDVVLDLADAQEALDNAIDGGGELVLDVTPIIENYINASYTAAGAAVLVETLRVRVNAAGPNSPQFPALIAQLNSANTASNTANDIKVTARQAVINLNGGPSIPGLLDDYEVAAFDLETAVALGLGLGDLQSQLSVANQAVFAAFGIEIVPKA